MARSRKPPRYPKKPHSSGQARIVLNGEHVYLGVWDSEASHREYNRLMALWHANGGHVPHRREGMTVAEMLVQFYVFAEVRYAGGREVKNFRESLGALEDVHGTLDAGKFGAKALKDVQAEMIRRGWCRNVVNRRVDRVRQVFRWAESEELVPAGTWHHLQAVQGIPLNHPTVKHSPKRQPAKWQDVLAVSKRLRRMPRHMLLLMWWSGMRTGEVRNMTTGEIDQAGDVWLYRPGQHKGTWRGDERVIALGPKAQALIRPYLLPDQPDRFIFSPQREREERFAAMRAARKTPVQPSQVNRAKKNPKRPPRAKYTRYSFAQAVRRAAKAAGVKLEPYALRHSARLRITREIGMDAARAVLGHKKFDTTVLYGGADTELAARAARQVG